MTVPSETDFPPTVIVTEIEVDLGNAEIFGALRFPAFKFTFGALLMVVDGLLDTVITSFANGFVPDTDNPGAITFAAAEGTGGVGALVVAAGFGAIKDETVGVGCATGEFTGAGLWEAEADSLGDGVGLAVGVAV